MHNIETLKTFLESPKNILIISHPRPDGDAMGSSLGLYNYLKSRKHEVNVIYPNEYPDYYKWMRGCGSTLLYNKNKKEADEIMKTAEIVFCLDFNNLSRVEPMDVVLKSLQVPFVLIDHHLEPDTFDYMFHSLEASSTCELVANFLELLEGKFPHLNKDIAHCLYTGLVTDTGNFQNSATTVRAFELAAKLMQLGVDIQFIQEKVFNTFKEERLRFIGNALLNRMVVMKDLHMSYISVTQEDVREYNLNAGDTEGLVNYPLTIRGIKSAVLLKEHGDIIKLSFRSKGDISMNDFARKYYEGGGHKNAAGGKSTKSLEATKIELVNYWRKEFSV
jgi:phosphoesterase RecJ-like protein